MPAIEVIQKIYGALGEKTVLLPLAAGTKKCLVKAWQKVKLEDTKVPEYVAKLIVGNVGVSLGAPSGGLCSIDFDDDAAATEFLDSNPALQNTLRTRGSRGCNIWVRIEGDYPTPCKLISKSQNKPVGEWRSTGNYTAVWGRHPSGCDYVWLVDSPAVTLRYAEIIWPPEVSPNEVEKTVRRVEGKPLSETLLENRRQIIEKLFEDVIWEDDRHGYCTCPGKDKHTQQDGQKDCRVFVDGVPTVHCFHSSCASEVARANAQLRTTTFRQEVVLLPDGYVKVGDSAEQLYEILKTTKRFFLRGSAVSTVSQTAMGPEIKPLLPVDAVSLWDKFTSFGTRSFKDGEEKISLMLLPKEKADVFLHAEERMILPSIEAVAQVPMLYKDAAGQLRIHSEGYSPATGIFILPRTNTRIPNVPLAEAVDSLKDLVSDFNFEGPSHRSRAIMSFITPAMVFAGLLGGRPPVDVAEADQSQAGKGYRHKLICALYGEHPRYVAQKNGGVGGLDESFQEALIRGNPFICLENVRGQLNSKFIEGFLTASETFPARGFGQREILVNVKRFVTLLSSNELDLTQDFANRSSVVRVLKRPDGYPWKRYGANNVSVEDWVWANQPYYLACVFRIVMEWHQQGCQTLPHAGHDFHWWAGRGEWIIQKLFNEAPMLEGHRSIQRRAGDPRLTWLQRLAYQAEKSKKLGLPMKMYELISLAGEGGFSAYRKPGDHNRQFTNDADELRYLGGIFAPLFRADAPTIALDGFAVSRSETTTTSGGQTYSIKTYTFDRIGEVSTPPAPDPEPPVSERLDQTPAISFTSTE